MNIKKIISLITSLMILLLTLSLPHKAQASLLFIDQFSGNSELHSYNPAYKHVDNFPAGLGSGGVMNVVNDHVEASGYNPGYVYTGIPGNNICASIDFNWSNGGDWTGIMIRSIPEATGDSGWSMFSVHGGDHLWFLYRFGYTQITGPITIDYSQTHTLKACLDGTTITGYLDGNLLVTAEDEINTDGYIGFSSEIGTKYLDNFKIESSSSQIDLDVPLFKQTSSPWGNQVYDSANLWNPQDPSIGAWDAR